MAESIESSKEQKKTSTRQIRKELNQLNKDLLRQKRADGNQRKEMMNLISQLKDTKETDHDERVNQAKRFMADRERRLAENGLTWAVTAEHDDIHAKMSREYQVSSTQAVSSI